MKVEPKILDLIREEIESIDYGTVTVNVNAKGNYIEVNTERRQRIIKEANGDTCRGTEIKYRHDGSKPDPIKI